MENESVARMGTNSAQIEEALQIVRPLTEDERQGAREQAQEAVRRRIGRKPQRADFIRHVIGRYPRWMVVLVAGLMLVVLWAAANVSVFRVFSAGRDHFIATLPGQEWQAAVVGASIFAMAEFMVIVSTIAASVLFAGRARWIMSIPIALGIAVALVGNWYIAQPGDFWSWLETIVPPVAVLFMAIILERLLLQVVEQRHANETAYQEALAEWQHKTAEPEKHVSWRATWANVLWDALRTSNARGRGAAERREYMASMNDTQRSAVVWREMQADNWFVSPGPFGPLTDTAPGGAPRYASTNGNNGHLLP